MTIAIPPNATAGSAAGVSMSASDEETASGTVLRLPGLAVAAIASLGAGAIHAGAIGIHAEHITLGRVFVATAVLQLGWGLVALMQPSRWIAAFGAAINLAAVGGWLLTRLSGVSFIGGLEQREAAQFADTACAILGAIAAALAFSAAMIGWRSAKRSSLAVPSLAVLAITLPAMLAGANHDHGSEAAPHDHGVATVDSAGATAAAGVTAGVTAGAAAVVIDESVPHDHGAQPAPVLPAAVTPGAATAEAATPTTAHSHDTASATAAAVVAPVPYDPTLPIDLGGVAGVTPQQQARAENLIALTLARLPQWSDPAVAEAAGFRSIGDGALGLEHYVQRAWVNDDVILDPDYPESLVYQPQADGSKKLMSAMFMLPDSVALADVPDIGGALTQWHIHNNLCYTPDPDAPKVAGLTNAEGECPAGLVKGLGSPMIHVWIQPHPCGPFAALEGVGAGQIQEGEERLCDHAHGAAGS